MPATAPLSLPMNSSPAFVPSVVVASESRLPVPTRDEVQSQSLFGPGRRLTIVHGDERYTLQITRAGKLLLTK